MVTFGLLVAIAACGGNSRRDAYAHATDAQRTCCENLKGDARAACLTDVIKIEDAAIAKTSQNQSTYACVAANFVCEPSTGRPTKSSAQKQLDCLEDLQ